MMKKLIVVLVMLPLFVFPQTHKMKAMGHISAPENMILKPGQMSKDGKLLFVPMIDTAADRNYVYVYKVKRSGKYKLKSKIEVGQFPEGVNMAGQLSITDDLKTMVSIGNAENSWNNNDLYLLERNDIKHSFDEVRTIGEINEYGKAEVYPWISADGNRLYYCFDNKVYLAKRKEGDRSFKFPAPLSIDFSNNVLSCFLSSDELVIYLVTNGGEIYKAVRDSKKDNFSKAELFADDMGIEGFFSSISVDDKGKTATLYYSGNEYDPGTDESITHMVIFRLDEIK